MEREPSFELETCRECGGAGVFLSGDGFAVYGDPCECIYSHHQGQQRRRGIPQKLDLRVAYKELS